jgi:uncharacterized protein (DUF2062 family)
MKRFLETRVLAPIRLLLTQGMSPRMLALSLAVGMVVGIFPVLGTTTVLCTIAAAAFRLNLIAVQTVHFLMTPIQLLMIIPFVRVGEWVLGRSPQALSISEGLALIAQGALQAISVLGVAIVHAVLGWVLLGPATLFLMYLALARILTATQRKMAVSSPLGGHP